MPVVYLFYENIGLSMHEIFLVQSTFSGSVFLMEIPSGYMGDKFRRKDMLTIGSFLCFTGFMTYFFSTGLIGCLIASFFFGVGTSFLSGTDSAMMYDTLKVLKREEDYLKFEGRASSIGNFAESLAAIIGGIIAISISIRTNFLVQASVMLVATIFMITSVEPGLVAKSDKPSFKTAMQTVFNEMRFNKRFRHIMMFSSFMGVNTLMMAWLVQPYLKEVLHWSVSEHLPIKEVFTANIDSWSNNGVAWVLTWMILNFVVGVFALNAQRIYLFTGKKTLIILIVLSLVMPYFFLNRLPFIGIVLMFFIFYAARGVVTPLFRDWINQSVGSEVRATALSVRSFLFRILFATLGPIVGYALDIYSMEYTFYGLGITFLFLAIPYLVFHLRGNHS